MTLKPLALAAAVLIAAAACGGPGASPTPVKTATPAGPTATPAGPTAPPSGTACTVGVSWNNFQQPRWAAHDEPNMKSTIEAGGGTYIRADANLSSEQQLTDVDNLISQGADVLVLLAQDQNAILPAVNKAKQQGIPVIAYDRLIEDTSILYLTFDNVGVGKAEAAALLAEVPTGNYVIIKGDPGDPNASTFLPEGFKQAGLLDKINSGDITVLNASGTNWPTDYGTYTDAWKTETAQANMETIIDKAVSDNKTIDAILAENDSTALGVVAALTAKNYGFPPLSGQDGDAANLNNVALGKQYVDVWKNANELGKAAGAAALQLCAGKALGEVTLPSDLLNPDVTPVAGLKAADFVTPGNNTVKSIILTPQPLTADKLQQPIDAGYVTKDEVCAGVDPASASAPAACK
jgi:D-xylose transport system substrate-binding protein